MTEFSQSILLSIRVHLPPAIHRAAEVGEVELISAGGLNLDSLKPTCLTAAKIAVQPLLIECKFRFINSSSRSVQYIMHLDLVGPAMMFCIQNTPACYICVFSPISR